MSSRKICNSGLNETQNHPMRDSEPSNKSNFTDSRFVESIIKGLKTIASNVNVVNQSVGRIPALNDKIDNNASQNEEILLLLQNISKDVKKNSEMLNKIMSENNTE